MKFYLRCNNCNHLNEMKSEYMVLCSSCGKKMGNNYTEWKQRNAGKTFEDYKQSAGVTEEQIASASSAKKGKKALGQKPLKEKIMIAVVTVLFASIGSWAGSSAVKAIMDRKKTNAEILEKQWVRKTYGDPGLTLETPWELQASDMEMPLDESVKAIIEKMQLFENPSEEFKVIVNTIQYKPEIGQLDLQGGADGSINEMRKTPGVSDLVYRQDPFSAGDIPGVIQRGSYIQKAFDVSFINILLVWGFDAWQVTIIMKKKDDVAKKAAERIVQSIHVES